MKPDQRFALLKFCALLCERCPGILTGTAYYPPISSEVVLTINVNSDDPEPHDGEGHRVEFALENVSQGPFAEGMFRLRVDYWRGNLCSFDEAPVFIGRALAVEAVAALVQLFEWCKSGTRESR